MAIPVSQAVTLSLNGLGSVTEVVVNETAPNLDTSDLSLAEGSTRTYIAGLKDAAEITVNHIGGTATIGNVAAGVQVGSLSFSYATVISTDVNFRVGELVAYTTTIRASN